MSNKLRKNEDESLFRWRQQIRKMEKNAGLHPEKKKQPEA
jgi:hypothetical protein